MSPRRIARCVVVPVFNESEQLVNSLGQISGHLAAPEVACEIVLVDDPSADGHLRDSGVRLTGSGPTLPLRAGG